jgi:hypothetical protein
LSGSSAISIGCSSSSPIRSTAVKPPWICLLALLISGHAYLLDLFNFSFAIGLYLLPAALSVWGAVLIAYRKGPPLLGRRHMAPR